MKKAIRIFITGSVQGVTFRDYVKQHADEKNLAGHVRNLEDGRLEIFLEGDGEAVDQVAAICRRGPQHAQIRDVQEKEEKYQDLKEFKILRF
ncbi:acylphosphatase [Candidatus Pacearchaeota archaeon]|jgi:acylphosphatase|nr:acylphosphatase [Candidatus Pacearchaeota archaeon]|tara:strand:+ start:174 stop:449 length:276 start_codon:yes stop_codon:yes gene_type:complete